MSDAYLPARRFVDPDLLEGPDRIGLSPLSLDAGCWICSLGERGAG